MLIFAFSSTQMSEDRAAAQAQINAAMNGAGRKAGGIFGTIGDIIDSIFWGGNSFPFACSDIID